MTKGKPVEATNAASFNWRKVIGTALAVLGTLLLILAVVREFTDVANAWIGFSYATLLVGSIVQVGAAALSQKRDKQWHDGIVLGGWLLILAAALFQCLVYFLNWK